MKEYVLREDVLRCVEEDGHDCELDLGYYDHNVAFQEIIKDIPAADVVEVRHGEWLSHPYKAGPLNMAGWECSVCGSVTPVDVSYYLYCPRCAARMDGGANNG